MLRFSVLVAVSKRRRRSGCLLVRVHCWYDQVCFKRPSPVASLESSKKHQYLLISKKKPPTPLISKQKTAHFPRHLPVERIIGITRLAQGPLESVGDVGTGHLALVVDFGDGDLHRGVVLGGDEAVRSAALARDVQVHDLALKECLRVSGCFSGIKG